MRAPAPNEPISESEAARLFAPLETCSALVLAVSGGPDSTALMWLAARWRDSLKEPPRLVAVTVDHGLRKESAAEARDVAHLAHTLGVEHRIVRWEGKKPETGIQEAARNARYRLLAEAAHEARSEYILTAHTLDDQAETVLFRMARGSGVGGLAGMRPMDAVPVPEGTGQYLIRPLLRTPKARLIATLDAATVPYAIDPSNMDPRFTRPRLRTLMPLLAEEGLTAERLSRLAQRVARVEDALIDQLDNAQQELAPGPWPEDGSIGIESSGLLDLPAEISIRLLQRAIAWSGDEGSADLNQLETLYLELREAIQAAEFGFEGRPLRRTLAGAMITLSGDKLTVERAPPRRAGAKLRSKSGTKPGKPVRKATFTKSR
jgi:tRNA(Ile)-lysidine synthase